MPSVNAGRTWFGRCEGPTSTVVVIEVPITTTAEMQAQLDAHLGSRPGDQDAGSAEQEERDTTGHHHPDDGFERHRLERVVVTQVVVECRHEAVEPAERRGQRVQGGCGRREVLL